MSSLNSSASSSRVNNGTVAVRQTLYTCDGLYPEEIEQYQTISAQPDCASFSLEELRLADYKQGHGSAPTERDDHLALHFAQTLHLSPRTDDKKHSSHLSLLVGPAIEIRVGAAPAAHQSIEEPVSWFLPKRLISYHSPFLEAACNRDFKERRDNLIDLPDQDPVIFALFVEWLYYGGYATQPFSLPARTGDQDVGIDAECWVLGDKLLCIDFKNYAMKRLYHQHVSQIFSRSISSHNLQFASKNSAGASKLRQLYVDLAATHFKAQDRVRGTVEEWDEALLSQPDLRLLLLQSFRLNLGEQNFVKGEEHYLEHGGDPH